VRQEADTICVVTFDVDAHAYHRFMGQYAEPLAVKFVDYADVREGLVALDVGCGPGALTAQLVRRLGAGCVAAIDPSPAFVAATRERLPDVDVRAGVAERLPFPDDHFDLALAQLVVHFMSEPVLGLHEVARVTRPGGMVAACVWDHAGGDGPLAAFWRAVRDLDPDEPGESGLAGARKGHLALLCEQAGLDDVEADTLSVGVRFATFEEWWEPYTLGVGPAGAYVARLDGMQRERLRARCAHHLPTPPFRIDASAWCVRARA